MRYLTFAIFGLLATIHSLHADDEFREFKGHTGPTRIGLFTSDSKLLVTCSGWPAGDGTVRVFDLKSAKELRVLKGHKANIDCMAMSPDGKFVYSGGGNAEGFVIGWDVATGKQIVKCDGQMKGQNVSCVQVSPDGKTVAFGGSNKKLFLCDATTGKTIRPLEGHTDLVRCLAFTPDGKKMCSGSWDGSVKVWEVATGKELLSFKPKTKWVQGLAMLPDGKRIVVASDEFSLWNIESGERIRKYQGGATCVEVSPDGKKMVSGFYDGKVGLWDVESGKREAEYQAHVGNVHGLHFSADGKYFSTAGGGSYKDGKEEKGTDFVVRVWKVEE